MRAVSKRRAAQLRTYRKLRAEFLTEHPRCEFPHCGYPASEVHHKRGRVGRLYLATEHWLPMCSPHHRWTTEHPADAYELGVSERRVGAA